MTGMEDDVNVLSEIGAFIRNWSPDKMQFN